MSIRICKNGHTFEKSSSCPICPVCSFAEMREKYGKEFPKIGAPAFRAIHSKGIATIEDLTNYTEQELLALHGFGPKALSLLRVELKKRQLEFKSQ